MPVSLCQPAASQAGSTWFGSRFWTDAFAMTFNFRLEYPTASIADGMTWALHNVGDALTTVDN